MADKTVRLTHLNGATVIVPADRADELVAGGQFTKPQARQTTTSK